VKDPFGREVNNLRISVTQRCNQYCIYCHREGQTEFSSNEMTPQEIFQIADASTEIGIKKIKLTGGEPLLRKDLVEIVKLLSTIQEIVDISLTTNGTLLATKAESLKKAGLSRVNISLDSLVDETYTKITRTNFFEQAKKGFFAAKKAGLEPIKLNMVILNGINSDQIEQTIQFAIEHGATVQLIELVTTTGCETETFYQVYHEPLDKIEETLKQKAKSVEIRGMQARRKYHLTNNATIELVGPMHNSSFCNSCNRIRITSDGQIKPCLLETNNHIDLLTPLRNGSSKEDLVNLFKKAISIRRPYFTD
jgi:cyclic pyranopterin phosphate synthase